MPRSISLAATIRRARAPSDVITPIRMSVWSRMGMSQAKYVSFVDAGNDQDVTVRGYSSLTKAVDNCAVDSVAGSCRFLEVLILTEASDILDLACC